MFSHISRQVRRSVFLPEGARGMATLKEIKMRIKSVTSIAKLTKTQSMVASSKLKAAQRKGEAARPYSSPTTKLFEPLNPAATPDGNLIVAVTSDKGMCGPINNQVVKASKQIIHAAPSAYRILTLGTKGTPALLSAFPEQFILSAKDLGKRDFNFVETGIVADQILRQGDFKTVQVIYNKFKNAMNYNVTTQTVPGYDTLKNSMNRFNSYEFEGDEDAVMRDLFEFHVGASIWGAMFENRNSELAARMTSMDNATKNANQIKSLLSIQYNRGRQSAITTELVEITSGASAIESGS